MFISRTKSGVMQTCLVAAVFMAGCQTIDKGANAKIDANASGKAKNVILFIGDGMGVSTVTAARIFDGQSRGELGEENYLSFEKFPQVALVKTYNTNQQVPDSAGTASAMHTGVKTRAGVVGVGPASHRGNCKEAQANKLETLGEIAKLRGKAVGIVTTARLTHATPAAVYAHTPERNWESDDEMTPVARSEGCDDIALQLTMSTFDVAMGGGKRHFLSADLGGQRLGKGENLAQTWQSRTGGNFVTTASAMEKANSSVPLLGLFSDGHMTYITERSKATTEPMLSDMTATALDHLSNKEDGYYLMVEGGRIDHGHHAGKAGYALTEVQEFAKAVAIAVEKTDPRETLILVTADHSHVFTIAGYPTRGNDILGLAHGNDKTGDPSGKPILATDGLPYTTLGYWNGPGANTIPRATPDTGVNAIYQAGIPTGRFSGGKRQLSETHAGEDVALYANGSGAEIVHGVIEQNEIFNIISTAFGWQAKP